MYKTIQLQSTNYYKRVYQYLPNMIRQYDKITADVGLADTCYVHEIVYCNLIRLFISIQNYIIYCICSGENYILYL